MRYSRAIVTAAAVLALATGCAEPDNPAPPNNPGPAPQAPTQPSPTEVSPMPPSEPSQPPIAPGEPPPGGIVEPQPGPDGMVGAPVDAHQIDASALPAGYPRNVATVSYGKRLNIAAQEGGCSRAAAELVEQTPQRVVVLLLENEPKTKQMCTMDIRQKLVSVDLADPLADRTVVLKYERRYV